MPKLNLARMGVSEVSIASSVALISVKRTGARRFGQNTKTISVASIARISRLPDPVAALVCCGAALFR